jgi:NADPH-ferrihemoprotein reductase
VGSLLCIAVRRSSFKLPPNQETPIILVGAGTGIAPLRGFYLERLHLRQRLDGGGGGNSSRSRDVLFYGCRGPAEDFLYQEELAHVVSAGGLAHVITAFSRQGAEKVYVQDRLREANNASLVASLIAAGAYVYVCGGTGMAMEVKQALTAALEQNGVADAAEHVQQLQACGRYRQDVWG